MTRILSVLFFIIATTVPIHSQTNMKDSLAREISATQTDSLRIPLLMQLHEQYVGEDTDSALYFLRQAEALINSTGAYNHLYKCSYAFTKILHANARYSEALEYTLKMKQAALEEKDRFREAFSYRTLFNIFHNLRENDSAVYYAIKSINLTREINDTFNLATNYGNLCWLYMDLNQYNKAREYGKMGVEAGERFKDTTGMLIALNNLALSYHRTGQNATAIPLFQRQLIIAKKVNKKRSIERALINLAACYYATGDVAALKNTVDQLNAQLEASPNKDPKIMSHQLLAKAYLQLSEKDFSKANETLTRGIEMARKDSALEPLMALYQTMSTLKAAQHDFTASQEFSILMDDVNTLLQEEELASYGMQLEKKFESEKKDALIKVQKADLRHKTTVNYVLIGSAAMLLLLSLLGYRNFRHRQKIQQQRISELELEKQLLASEAVLKGEEKERTRLAKDLHDGLGGMLSGIKHSLSAIKENLVMTPENALSFEQSIDMLNSSIHEMRRVAHNLMPEVLLKFGLDTALKDFCDRVSQSNAIKVSYQSIDLDTLKIDQSKAVTIYRVVQELLNNTMKHSDASQALVQISVHDNELSVTVEDNGKGFNPQILEQSAGMGWSNIKNRIEFMKGSWDISSKPGQGTSIYITIPVES